MEPSSEPVPLDLPTSIRGSCRCGKCIYISSTLPLSITLCHCVECRKASGSPFLSFGLFHNTALQWLSSHPNTDPPIATTLSHVRVQGTPIAVRGACGECGSPLFMKYHCRPDATSVVMGIVDDGSVVGSMPKPKEHIFLKERAQWFDVQQDDRMARHEGFNEAFQKRLREWILKGCIRREDAIESRSGRVIHASASPKL